MQYYKKQEAYVSYKTKSSQPKIFGVKNNTILLKNCKIYLNLIKAYSYLTLNTDIHYQIKG